MRRMIFKCSLAAALLSGFLLPTGSIAQESAQPKEFYKKDYAVGSVEKEVVSKPAAKEKQASPEANSAKEGESPAKTGGIIGGEELERPRDVFAEGQGKKVKTLGVVVLGTEAEHLNTTLGYLRDKSNEMEVPVGEVFFLGGANHDIDGKAFLALGIMGARFQFTFNRNDAYEVSQSPTWIIETEEGITLLEGIENIDKFFNRKGEFVDKSESQPGVG